MRYAKKTAERHERFAREYCIDLNGKRTAIAAGYSPKTAEAMASRLIRNRKVSELIAKLKAEQCAQLSISANWVLGELRKLAGYDAAQVFDDDGGLKPLSSLAPDLRAAIVSIEHDKLFEHFAKGNAKPVGTTRKIKFADKIRALELLGKHLKLFTDKVELGGELKLADLLQEARQRHIRLSDAARSDS